MQVWPADTHGLSSSASRVGCDFGHGLQGTVYIIGGVKRPDAKANAAIGRRAEALVNKGGAVDPYSDCNIKVTVQNGPDIGRIKAPDICCQEPDVVGESLRTIELDAGQDR